GQPRPTARRLDGDAFEALAPALTAGARRIVGELTPPRRALDLADNAAWGALYRLGGDGWELGRPAPPLVDHFARNPPRGRALVVGCGRGHEARLLASHGVTVVAIDVASEAIAAARAIGEAGVTFRQADLFAVPDELGAFDLVVEHCCFCAIPPERRGDYVEAVANTLRRDGRYVGLFRDHGDPMGPPYAISPDEVASRFAPRFVLEAALPARGSVLTRAGHEFIALLRLR
ncbi:MAG: methyltransferase domain-containing protein, partial [Myxococcales bacterium]|nr:methyltransferase domain-containing protein [Myxococcales bacterium]